MALHWIPPPQGTLKINTHGTSINVGNDTGFAAVYRDVVGGLRHLTLGVIPEITPLGNQLWAIFIALKRAFLTRYRDIIVETDNLQAYRTIRNFHNGAPAAVYDIVSQIDIRLRDTRWLCLLAFVFPARNRAARYASRMAMELCDGIYTLDHPVGGVEELLDWDMGMGLDHPNYIDVVIANEAPDPVDFGGALALTDQLENLGIGQIGAPAVVVIDVEMDENLDDMEEVIEETIHGGLAAREMFAFEGDAVQEVD